MSKVNRTIKKVISAFTAIMLLASVIFGVTGCRSNSVDTISLPDGLTSNTKAALSQAEQDVLMVFITELVNAYNSGDVDTPLNRTDLFDDSFDQIGQLAQTNDYLSDAQLKGFLIVMSASMGATSPGKNSTPEEVRDYIKEQIKAIIEIYCVGESSQANTPEATIATEQQEVPTQETAAPTTPPEAKPVLVDVYADENCLIQFYTVEKDSKYYIAKFRVTNYTSRTLTFQSGCISFNGESTNNITLSDEIAPNSAGTIEIKLKDLDTEYFDIQNIHKISGSFRIIDFNDENFHEGNHSYNIKYVDVEIPCDSITELTVNEGSLLYDDDKVTIAFLQTEQIEEYTYAHFRVTNKTMDVITIQSDGLSFNGETASRIVCSEEVAPLSTGNIELKCTIDTTFVDLSNITTLSGTIRVIAFDNENFHDGNHSYNATFQFPENEPTQPDTSNDDFTASVADWVTRYNEKCGDAWGADPIDSQTIPSYIDDSGIFRYPIAEWITLIIYPADDATIEKVSLKFDPAGQKGAWIMRVFSLNELMLEVTYPSVDSDQANAVTAYYEDTFYSGSWNWPEQGTKGKYTKDGIDCDLYRAVDSLLFVVNP